MGLLAPQFSAARVGRWPPDTGTADTLIVALHGGGQSTANTLWEYLDFRAMSQLEYLAAPGRTVVMPQAPLRTWAIYRERDVKELEKIIKAETPVGQTKPRKLIGLGFSQGATFLAHACRYIPFDGVVICSGIRPPLDGWRSLPSRKPISSLIWVGLLEPGDYAWYRPLRATHEAAEELHSLFSGLGPCRLETHIHGHRWPSEWNQRIVDYFGL